MKKMKIGAFLIAGLNLALIALEIVILARPQSSLIGRIMELLSGGQAMDQYIIYALAGPELYYHLFEVLVLNCLGAFLSWWLLRHSPKGSVYRHIARALILLIAVRAILYEPCRKAFVLYYRQCVLGI